RRRLRYYADGPFARPMTLDPREETGFAMPARSKEFQRRLDAAVHDPELATALSRSLSSFNARRTTAFSSLDFAGMQADLHQRKVDAIERLPELIEQFTREAEAVGSVVHMAKTPEDA